MDKRNHLVKSKKPYQDYHFRCWIPKDLEKFFLQKEFRVSLKGYSYSKCKIISIGHVTSKEIESTLGKKVYACPEEYTSEGIIDLLNGTNIVDVSFLLPRAAVAREFLPEGLKSLGAKVQVVPAYQTEFVKFSKDSRFFDLLLGGEIDMVTFLSSSSVNAFVDCFTVVLLKEFCE